MMRTVKEISDQLAEQMATVRVMEGKVAWHVARAGMGGSHGRAAEYLQKRDEAMAEAQRLSERLLELLKYAKAEVTHVRTAEDLLEELGRLSRPRTKLGPASLRDWGDKQKEGRLGALRLMALRSETFGMEDWSASDFRESVHDWFWDGLKGTKSYSERKAIGTILEHAKAMLDEGVTLEDVVAEWWEEDR